ncbi:hypothetical protein CY35_06G008500 [Sphagnum magellanicum]|nr:hypothetical protein CY35_06G008500 [Sphagnum magellanicum]
MGVVGVKYAIGEAATEYWVLLVLAAIGFLYVLRLISLFLPWIYVTFLRPAKPLSRYGDWALITGATDGIGKAFTGKLAKKKINLVIVGRSQPKLEELAKELHSKYGVEVRFVVVDFTDDDLDGGLSRISQRTADIHVGILINNVGISYPYARFFHELDEKLTKNLLRVNIEVTTRVIQLFLPSMLKHKRGAIINVGSGAGSVLPSDPLYTLYAATKAFVDQLSRSLYVEYKHSGIDVQCQVPLYVATKMAKIRKASLAVPSPDTYATAGLKWVGYEPRCTPYWVHSIMWWLIQMIPEPIMDSVRLRSCLNIRKRGQAKEARSKAE